MKYHKYHNKKTIINGMQFDSKNEAIRYQELLLLENAGEIKDLQTQVKYKLLPAQYIAGKCVERAVTYIADFVYQQKNGIVVEDVKGFKTKDYIIKRKLMLYMHGIKIKET